MFGKRIHGRGPKDAEFFFCGSAPGFAEDKSGKVFSGKTGEELDRFLDGNRLPTREFVFLTNLYRTFGGKDYVHTVEDLATDAPDLLAELKRIKPMLIVPMGRDAIRYFLGDVDVDAVWGIPYYVPRTQEHLSFLAKGTVILGIHHPASGFHNPEMSAYVAAGFEALANYVDGVGEPRILFHDPYPEPHYEEITTVEGLETFLAGAQGRALRIGFDTEGYTYAPWSAQLSYVPGTGCLIKHKNHEVLQRLGDYFRRVRPRLIYHSALHELGMLRVLGLPQDMPFDDTLVMAYLLQLEPQGLKSLAPRHTGMRMHDYMEIVAEPAQRLALDYFTALWDCEQLDWEAAREDAFWREIDNGRKISVLPKLPKSALHKACERLLRSKDSRKLWENQIEDIQVAGYNRLGPLPEVSLDYAEPTVAIDYGSRDADATLRVADQLEPRIDALGLRAVYELELGTYPLIERMAYVGLKPDLGHMANLSAELQMEIDYQKHELVTATGNPDFNANSGDQVAAYIFDTLGLEGMGKKTATGRFNTNDKTLEALEHEYPEHAILTNIRSYREYYKLKNTFVDRLKDHVNRYPHDGRVHTTFRTTRVVTGRLSASNPNLLAMPKHGKFAKAFRQGWIADEGHVLAEWDLSQVELRVAAHLSQDPLMLAIYRGEKRNPDGSFIDLHAALGERIFGVKAKDQDKSKHRLPCKAINFGFWMGQTYKGLQVELAKNGMRVSDDDAQRWLDDADAAYTGAKTYKTRMIAEAKRNGCIRCLSGRIRYIGGIRSRDERVRAEAERFAFSTPVQEGAQLLMKTAEIKLWALLQDYWKQGKQVEPLIQVHDALTLEAEETPAFLKTLNRDMMTLMTAPYPGFTVPIETSGDYGHNWADMEPFEETK